MSIAVNTSMSQKYMGIDTEKRTSSADVALERLHPPDAVAYLAWIDYQLLVAEDSQQAVVLLQECNDLQPLLRCHLPQFCGDYGGWSCRIVVGISSGITTAAGTDLFQDLRCVQHADGTFFLGYVEYVEELLHRRIGHCFVVGHEFIFVNRDYTGYVVWITLAGVTIDVLVGVTAGLESLGLVARLLGHGYLCGT